MSLLSFREKTTCGVSRMRLWSSRKIVAQEFYGRKQKNRVSHCFLFTEIWISQKDYFNNSNDSSLLRLRNTTILYGSFFQNQNHFTDFNFTTDQDNKGEIKGLSQRTVMFEPKSFGILKWEKTNTKRMIECHDFLVLISSGTN